MFPGRTAPVRSKYFVNCETVLVGGCHLDHNCEVALLCVSPYRWRALGHTENPVEIAGQSRALFGANFRTPNDGITA